MSVLQPMPILSRVTDLLQTEAIFVLNDDETSLPLGSAWGNVFGVRASMQISTGGSSHLPLALWCMGHSVWKRGILG